MSVTNTASFTCRIAITAVFPQTAHAKFEIQLFSMAKQKDLKCKIQVCIHACKHVTKNEELKYEFKKWQHEKSYFESPAEKTLRLVNQSNGIVRVHSTQRCSAAGCC